MLRHTARALVLGLALALPAAGMAAGAAHAARIEGMKFEPERLEVTVGDTITWTNRDVVPHTVTGAGRSLESGTIAPGGKWTYRVRAKGEIAYVCRFHPMMKGVLVAK
ncbi:MAG TPA: cupredoxin family copper-binding protein [Burkholderiales bacterium]|nr:cupredoxin family copper-binding protein [Burkholderiales bacterium]